MGNMCTQAVVERGDRLRLVAGRLELRFKVKEPVHRQAVAGQLPSHPLPVTENDWCGSGGT